MAKGKEKFFNIIQKNQRMSTQFAWLTTILIAIVSIVLAVSVINLVINIMNDITVHNKKENMIVSSKIFDKINETFGTPEYSKTENEINILLKNQVIAFVTIKLREDDSLVYNVDGKIKYEITDRNYQSFAPQYITPKYLVTIGFYGKDAQKDYLSAFMNKLMILTLSGIFFSLLMAYFMFKIVSSPLEKLISVAEKYKQGNFTVQLEYSNYEEINTLIDTYNSMGKSLDELYTSLEMKVEERTVELANAYKELQNTQALMVHSEKMKSLGELVAGITHEINNPVNFIYGNLIHLQNYTNDMIGFINELVETLEKNGDDFVKTINELKEKYDYDFIADDLPALIKSCQEGANRTKNIINDLKNFSRMGESTTSSVDLPKEIDTTLNILNNKIKNRITIEKDYPADLPKIDALGGQLNQVFMNILDNATYAIENEGVIKIKMSYNEKYVTIEIADNGKGMSKDVAEKIFDPFFTTKPVGEGTGLGMAISYKVIKNHGGTIKVESEENVGTKFTIELPIENSEIKKGE